MADVVAFLSSIGLVVRHVASVSSDSFLPGIEIRDGEILLSPDGTISSLLHEAGHVACIPTRYRSWVSGDVEEALRAAFKDLNRHDLVPDHALTRAMIQCGDSEATAWAWAAGVHLGIPPAAIIEDLDYNGAGGEVRLGLSVNAYCGINGLAHAGMCKFPRHGDGYPKMLKWLQDADLPRECVSR